LKPAPTVDPTLARDFEGHRGGGFQTRPRGIKTGYHDRIPPDATSPSDDIGHYRIKQKLGSGGMGDVYLAEDLKLHRSVALKVLPADVAGDPQRRLRFLHEAHAASVLNHPNVSTIYEVGEADDTVFIAMELIEGKTLTQVRESRTCEIDEVIDIAMQAADALDEAHSRGIVHRDIKSANIMLTPRGHVKVLDFGLAKLRADADVKDEDTRIKTSPGLVIGTPSYMSPEQALGRAVDHRSDLFSLGIVLYELIAGRLPFEGATTTETIQKITNSQPDPIARFNYSAPPELERIVRKLLEKDPERRYQSAHELLVDLKNLKRDTNSGEVMKPAKPAAAPIVSRKALLAGAGVLAILAIAIAIGVLMTRRAGGPAPAAGIDSIAVLPFVNTAKDPETEYLSDGISESIINNLAGISSLRVIPRSTVFRYKGKDTDLAEIAKELDVRAIVSGRVLQRGDTLSVQAELIDTESNAQIWGGRYEKKLVDALALQKEISDEISAKLRPGSTQVASRNAPAMTDNAEAYQLYLKGRYHWNKRTGDGIEKALDYFQQAVAKDPDFALAHVGVADTYLIMEQYSDRPAAEGTDKAEVSIRRALALDEGIAEAHASLGAIHQNRRQWAQSDAEFRRSIELKPDYPTARHWYNIMLRFSGKIDEAYEQVMVAQRLDPLSMIIGVNVVDVLMLKGRDDEALATAEKYMEIDPNFPQLLGIISELYSRAGRHQEAIASAKKAVELSGGTIEQTSALGNAYAAAGDRARAEEILRSLENRVNRGEGDSYHLASLYLRLGDRDRAIAALERALEKQSGMVVGMNADVRLTSLRTDPRFQAMARSMGIR
jgi:TolB-like protein/Flp pilus assembly protein TadD/predicted Ser/Thr protein kinase